MKCVALCLGLLPLAAPALADQRLQAKNIVTEGLVNLVTGGSFALSLNGEILVDGIFQEEFQATSYWNRNGAGWRVEGWVARRVRGQKQMVPEVDFVGDGTTFWRYLPSRNRYSAVAAKKAQDYASLMQSYLSGPEQALSLFQMDLFTRLDKWSPRNPLARAEVTPGEAVRYLAGNPVNETLTYEFYEDEDDNLVHLQKLRFERSDLLGQRPRVTRWTLSIYDNFVPTDVDFTFVVPPKAQSMASPVRVRD